MVIESNREINRPIEFLQVREAFRVFSNDYQIVKHPDTPFSNPFKEPNGPDAAGHRQYNLTVIPDEMTEDQFLERLKGVLVVSCMDRDAVKPFYDKLKKTDPQTPIVLLSIAGGIVQEHEERKQALSTILTYISQHQQDITQVLATDHDHTCGYIKYALNGIPLADKLKVASAVPGKHSHAEEQKAMKSLIAQNVNDLGLKKMFGDKLSRALVVIDRTGNVETDMNFADVQPKKLADF